ncbi:MAG: sigma-54-dependent Fis family transcriptional regulator, partial [Chitinispirillaceae bacterium]|nr:sigma-54-dependent Fis family transcriptional regulator [Chitinispirillaceae bacterium]
MLERETATKILDEIELHRRNSSLLETLYSILEKIIAITERDEAITILLKELQTLIGLEISSIYLVKERKFGILEKSGLEWSEEYPVVSKSVLNRVLETKTPLILDIVDNEDVSMKTLIKFKIKQALCFPVIQREGNVLAIVYFVSRDGGKIEVVKNDTNFIKAISSFIAIILEYLSLLEKEREEAYVKAKKSGEQHYVPIISKLKEEKENLSLKLKALKEESFFGLDFNEYCDLRQFIERASPTGLPILICGETGVGKSLFAKAIHNFWRKNSPFIVIDCTTIPKELLESELFGYEKGAFTGATSKKAGKVSLAEGGTLFIDEIGDLELPLQAKLLRFLQSGEYEALGSSVTLRSNARIIAATNKDLRVEVAQKRFREDLYYRLNVLTIQLPPLRTRPEMILRFAEYFLDKYKITLNPQVKGFADSAKNLLVSYNWPGNIRELENCIMRALVNAEGELIEAHHCALYSVE